ncbi:CYR1_1 [Sanghuangporus vaninii]
MNPIAHRMVYHGPMVDRSARIAGIANGGQIICSADVVGKIRSQVLNKAYDPSDPDQKVLVSTVEGIGVEVVSVGDRRVKGLDIPEMLSLIYPKELIWRSEPILTEKPVPVHSSAL